MIQVLRVILEGAGLVGLGLLALPGLFAFVMWLRGPRSRVAQAVEDRWPRLVFLIPAHNERLLVRSCVRSILDQDYPPDRRRVMVIADNCSDETAAIARAEGAEALERTDPERPGKPRALAWAITLVGCEGVDAFVIVDGDSEVASDFASQLARFGNLRNCAIQTYNGISNEYETWLTRLAGLLTRLRFERQFPAKVRAGLNVPLSNGMVLGSELLQRRPWGAFSVCEDWELYAEYTAFGEIISYVPARVTSQEARSTSQSGTQRQRWQAGRREVRLRWGPGIRAARGITLPQKIDAHLELYWPSPAVHMALAVACVGAAAFGGASLLLLGLALCAAIGEMGLGLGVIVVRHPQPLATLRALAWAPVYTLWRLGVAVRARLSQRARTEWVRTVRHEHR